MNVRFSQLPVSDAVVTVGATFQGDLVQITYAGSLRGSDAPDDALLVRKEHERVLFEWLHDGKIPASAAIRNSHGDLLGCDLSPAMQELVYIEAQARVMARKELLSKSRRGRVANFSRKSRLNMLRLVARLDKSVRGLFLTFTYRENMQDYVTAKYHLDLLLRWLTYHAGEKSSILWRMENQPNRGAIHFHIIVFNISYMSAEMVTAYWQELTGDDSYPDIKRLTSKKKVMIYVSKYLAKESEPAAAAAVSDPASAAKPLGLDDEPYLENSGNSVLLPADHISDAEYLEYAQYERFKGVGEKVAGQDDGWRGRYWGSVSKAKLPFAVAFKVTVTVRQAALMNFRRAIAKKRYAPAKRRWGYTVFAPAAAWCNYFHYCLREFSNGKPVERLQNISSGYRLLGSMYDFSPALLVL